MHSVAATRRVAKIGNLPSYVDHPSFRQPATQRELENLIESNDLPEKNLQYMPDELTRQLARCMHYAAHRAHQARRTANRQLWLRRYYCLRDRIVLGNRKLIFRAVRRRLPQHPYADDLAGDCHIVLIHAVSNYNPWLNIRFSTYAYTCIVRALCRTAQRWSNDHLMQAVPFEALPDGEPNTIRLHELREPSAYLRLDEYLRRDHPLLTPREKAILSLRFGWNDENVCPTLEQVGRWVGLSKERVRQVQTLAINKLRLALLGTSA